MEHSPRIKFLIPRRDTRKVVLPTIRDQMEFHEQLDNQYDTKIKEHVQKALHKRREEARKRMGMFLNCLLLSHILVIVEVWLAWRIYKALFG